MKTFLGHCLYAKKRFTVGWLSLDPTSASGTVDLVLIPCSMGQAIPLFKWAASLDPLRRALTAVFASAFPNCRVSPKNQMVVTEARHFLPATLSSATAEASPAKAGEVMEVKNWKVGGVLGGGKEAEGWRGIAS